MPLVGPHSSVPRLFQWIWFALLKRLVWWRKNRARLLWEEHCRVRAAVSRALARDESSTEPALSETNSALSESQGSAYTILLPEELAELEELGDPSIARGSPGLRQRS